MDKKQFKQYMFVIEELTGREIKRKYSRSKLGVVWSVLNPLLHMVVTSLVFSTMFDRSIENYPVYFLCGNVLWTLFTTGTNTAMTSLVDNKQMLIKVKTPMQVFVISRVYTATVNFGYSLIAFIPILLFFRMKLHLAMLFLPIIFIFELLFTVGFSMALSVGYVFFGDIKYLYGILLQLWMYLSALFYPVANLPDVMKRVVGNNPVYLYIASMRDIVMHGEMPNIVLLVKMIVWSFGTFLLGTHIFKKQKNHILQKL